MSSAAQSQKPALQGVKNKQRKVLLCIFINV